MSSPKVINLRGYSRAVLGAMLRISLFTATAAVGADAAADNLLGTFGTPLTVYHLYSAADGRSRLELSKLAGKALPDMRQAIVSRGASGVNIFYFKDGDWSPWHVATDRYLVTLLQGQFVIDVGDGKEHRLVPGNVLYSEDWSGKGHRTLCIAKSGQKVCVLEQIILEKVDKSQSLPKD